MTSLDIRNFTRKRQPSFPYQKVADLVLPDWEVSLVFAGETRAQHLNKTLRNKTYVPNVLSYEIGKKSGEIVICLQVAKRQAPDYELSYQNFVGFLFIHGLLHLKGRRHGTTMESEERALMARFADTINYNGTQNRNRN